MRVQEPPHINPGQLRHVVNIEQPGPVQSASGAVTNSWPVFAAGVRCDIEPQGGAERFGAETFFPESTHRVTMRYLAGLTSSMRINFGGRLFEILNFNDVRERNRVMVLSCKEGKSHGNV